MDLQIRQGSREAIPLFFDFIASKISNWAGWVDKELADNDFFGCLVHASILKSVARTRNLEGFLNFKGFRHLVPHWSPSLHTFFFFVDELIITLEDMVNTSLLMFGDERPLNIQLSTEDLVVKEKLFKHFGGHTTSPEGKLARIGRWVKALSDKEKSVRQAMFIALWLSKFLFSEFPGYRIKSVFFPLAICITRGISYPLVPMFLGHLYSQLDLVHADKLAGNSCYTISSSLQCTML